MLYKYTSENIFKDISVPSPEDILSDLGIDLSLDVDQEIKFKEKIYPDVLRSADSNLDGLVDDFSKKYNIPDKFKSIPQKLIDAYKSGNSLSAYLALIGSKVFEFLMETGLFAGISESEKSTIKEVISEAISKDVSLFVEKESKKRIKKEFFDKDVDIPENKEVGDFTIKPGFDDMGYIDFPARYKKTYFYDFMDVILGIESSNTDWGEWIENYENYGAIGPSQIMYFNFPEWMEDSGYNWNKYYNSMTSGQKKFWDDNVKKGVHDVPPTGYLNVASLTYPPRANTRGSLMAALLRHIGATEGDFLEKMTIDKFDEYFSKHRDWAAVAALWNGGPKNLPPSTSDKVKEYVRLALSDFLMKKESCLLLKKLVKFSSKLDEKKLKKESRAIDRSLRVFISRL